MLPAALLGQPVATTLVGAEVMLDGAALLDRGDHSMSWSLDDFLTACFAGRCRLLSHILAEIRCWINHS